MLRGGIGFFDSGVGGLSVLYACLREVKGYPVYYYGDNRRAPYGNQSINKIRAYAYEAFSFFERVGARVVVIACNTVTALLIDELRLRFPFPIIGVEPAILPAVRRADRILVLATPATAQSERLQALVNKALALRPEVQVRVVGCNRLASIVEQGLPCNDMQVTAELPRWDADCVVLGCTHYSFLKREISEFYNVEVLDGNRGVAHRLQIVLKGLKAAEEIPLKTPRRVGGSSDKNNGEYSGVGLLKALSFFARENRQNPPKFRLKKMALYGRAQNAQSLYFVGSGRVYNRHFCERLFTFYK